MRVADLPPRKSPRLRAAAAGHGLRRGMRRRGPCTVGGWSVGRHSILSAQRDWTCTKNSRQRRQRAGRFAAKNAPAGQRQIGTIPTKSVRAGRRDDASLRQPPPAALAEAASGGSWSTRLVALTPFGFIVGFCRFRRLGPGVVRLCGFPPLHAL